MGAWDSYEARVGIRGSNRREVVLKREQDFIRRKLESGHLSYHHVVINGEDQDVAIMNTDNFEIKTIISMPGENIKGGSIVEWMGHHWLITSKDYNTEVYAKCTMTQCNYLVRWIAEDRSIVERWCVIEDGTKYLTGETVSQYNENGMSLGDTRISMSLPRDEYSLQLHRDHRFLIDDYDSKTVLAYRLTKPFKLGGVYGNEGAMTFVLTEVNTEDDDNFELHIADYYKYFPRTENVAENVDVQKPESVKEEGGKKVWL